MKFITITSGKGGVGKSLLAANISYMLSQYGYKVALFDADVGLANQDIILGVNPKYTLLDVLKGNASFKDAIVEINKNFLFIPGESGEEILEYKNSEILKSFYEGVEELGELDYLIIDTGAGIGETVRSFIKASTDTVVVTMPDPSAVMDAYSMIKYTAKEKDEVFLILNYVRNKDEAIEIAERLKKVSKKHIGEQFKIEYLGYLERSRLVEESTKKRELVVKNHASSIPALQIADITKKLTNSLTKDGEHIKDTPNVAIFFKRLFQQS
ncbi:MAG: MinD/ParA family protein [Epsilonproteobacteria bacterium]|nr:MinD/ParA family protein [Campylobacterota bacterium]